MDRRGRDIDGPASEHDETKDEFEKKFIDRTSFRWADRRQTFEDFLPRNLPPTSGMNSHVDLAFTDSPSLWQSSEIGHVPHHQTELTTMAATAKTTALEHGEKIVPTTHTTAHESKKVSQEEQSTASAISSLESKHQQQQEEEPDEEMTSTTSLPSKELALDPPVFDLITIISNMDTFIRELQDLGFDISKFTMDQLNKIPVMECITVLTKIEDSISALKTAESRHQAKLHNCLTQQSKRYYERVIHAGVDPTNTLKDELDLIDTISDVKKAMAIMAAKKMAGFSKELGIYRQLRYLLTPLPKEAPEYAIIQEYANSTGRRMATPYDLEIMDIFRLVDRDDTQKPTPLGNKQLLWYVGNQRISSMLRLLSEGPTIPSPRYPRSGFPFGRGVYFSDIITKSANNCCASHQHPIGFVLLCEVELGNPHIMYNRPDNPSILPPEGCHSVWAKGKTAPDSVDSQKIDDAIVPIGRLQKQSDVPDNSPLLYNEYIVYNPKQAVPKYLLKLNFKFTMKL